MPIRIGLKVLMELPCPISEIRIHVSQSSQQNLKSNQSVQTEGNTFLKRILLNGKSCFLSVCRRFWVFSAESLPQIRNKENLFKTVFNRNENHPPDYLAFSSPSSKTSDGERNFNPW